MINETKLLNSVNKRLERIEADFTRELALIGKTTDKGYDRILKRATTKIEKTKAEIMTGKKKRVGLISKA